MSIKEFKIITLNRDIVSIENISGATNPNQVVQFAFKFHDINLDLPVEIFIRFSCALTALVSFHYIY